MNLFQTHFLLIHLIDCYILSNSQKVPYWSASWPNATAPLGGYSFLPNRTNYQIFEGSLTNGAYNHAVMIGYHYNTFTTLWKNCQKSEDCNGQRILYSQSKDGKKWSTADIFFRNLTTASQEATLFVGPPLIINGRQYVGASPGKHNSTHDQSAQGAQFCLYPQPIDPRNCGPASEEGIVGQENNTLLMREILPGIGKLGTMFWASDTAPIDFEDATKTFNIPTLNEMDNQTQNDIKLLTKQMDGFCDGENKENSTLKCEVVQNGILDYNSIDQKLVIANELTHYILPSNDGDVLLYRSNSNKNRFYASLRNFTIDVNTKKKIFGNWTSVAITNIPDVNANLNCGQLPNGKIMLLSNPVYNRPGRDPVTLSTTSDGYNFDQVGVIMSCTDLSDTSTCKARNTGNKDGPAYPQGITIVDPASFDIQGVWVVASNNKEDIWITHVPFSAIP